MMMKVKLTTHDTSVDLAARADSPARLSSTSKPLASATALLLSICMSLVYMTSQTVHMKNRLRMGTESTLRKSPPRPIYSQTAAPSIP